MQPAAQGKTSYQNILTEGKDGSCLVSDVILWEDSNSRSNKWASLAQPVKWDGMLASLGFRHRAGVRRKS